MKKVLIITYYWPPSGSSGVQRTLYFVKYLRDFGWEPIVFTPKNPEYPAIDKSLTEEIPDSTEVIKHPIWEPYKIFKKITGKSNKDKIKPQVVLEKNKSFLFKLSVFIRGNFFIPDARKFWINPSVKYLENYLKENPVDLIFSSSPPQSVHLIAMKLKQRLNIPWVADFRDPWTRISYFNNLMLTKFARQKHEKFEKEVLKNANEVTTVSNACKNDFEEIGRRNVALITNGFDGPVIRNEKPVEKFTISYIGTLNSSRVPDNFWNIIKKFISENDEIKNRFQLNMIGNIEDEVFANIANAGLEQYLYRKDYINHNEVLDFLSNSFCLLLFGIKNDPGVLTGKVFEYLQAGRPIYSIGPENGDINTLLKKTKAGWNADYHEYEKMYENLLDLKEVFKSNKWGIDMDNISQYSRKKLTEDLSHIFNKACKN